MATIPEERLDTYHDADAPASGTYHFLDVGGAKYGECVLVVFGKRRVLIDGSHEQDFAGQAGYRSIPRQLADILQEPAPHAIDLIVVTHGHADHVGCLPELFDKGVIRPHAAYLTHPKIGFGRAADESPSDAGDAAAMKLEALLREEDASDLDDTELAAFMDAVETVERRYRRFVDALEEGGVDVHFHLGGDLPGPIAERLSATGITLLGPSEAQLLLCAEQISKTNREAQDAISAARALDTADVIAVYRRLVGSPSFDAGFTRGNAMNCQSIVFAFGPPGERVLLAGDMQFAEPGVRGTETEVARLRDAVVAAGPYSVFKTTHHTSHNGQDDGLLHALGNPAILVHSGGLRDESHPYPSVLVDLSARAGIAFARTDRNGLITVRPGAAASKQVLIARGELNDFSRNARPDEVPLEASTTRPGAVVVAPQSPASAAAAGGTGAGPQIIIVNLPPGAVDMTVAGVDIVVRDPGSRKGASWTGVPSRSSGAPAARDETGELAGLLFVTDADRLRANVGRVEADAALTRIEERGGRLLNGSGDGLSEAAIAAIGSTSSQRGVVIVGGYDVVPPHRVDSLDPELRHRLRRQIPDDDDQFWVWSDAAYADLDGDGLAELPVSRMPDARDARLLRAGLSTNAGPGGERFGIRNVARPFADEVWTGIAGSGDMLVSEPFTSAALDHSRLGAVSHYHMLHGDLTDGTGFTGEDRDGYPVAFEVRQVPTSFAGVVFAGCCWGALIVDGSALDYPDRVPPPRVVEASIALSYLRAGARAFVGCTGAHYSGPSVDRTENYALRLHEAFWEHLEAHGSASRALHEAKLEYAESIVQGGALDPLHTARRLKNLAQFTCLGLGW